MDAINVLVSKLEDFINNIRPLNVFDDTEDSKHWKSILQNDTMLIDNFSIITTEPIVFFDIAKHYLMINTNAFIGMVEDTHIITEKESYECTIQFMEYLKTTSKLDNHKKFHIDYPNNVYSKYFTKLLEYDNTLGVFCRFYFECDDLKDHRLIMLPFYIEDDSTTKNLFDKFYSVPKHVESENNAVDDFYGKLKVFNIVFNEKTNEMYDNMCIGLKKYLNYQ